MVKVIEEPVKPVRCPGCGKLLQYEKEDAKPLGPGPWTQRVITCPVCKFVRIPVP
jgi:ribosomal protein S27E